MSTQPVPAEAGALTGRKCATCLAPIQGQETSCLCPECRSPYHRECWDEVGGCATYGCTLMAASEIESSQRKGAEGWGDEKVCPSCGKTIKSAATKCRFCKTAFPSSAPLDEREFAAWTQRQAEVKPAQRVAVVLFAASLIGFLGPLLLLIGIPWVVKNRPSLVRAGGVYPVLAFFGLGLSVFYTLLMMLELVF